MKYIIMCGGDDPQQEHPRHIWPIKGEPIVARTIRLLRQYGVDDISISTNNRVFEQFGVPLIMSDKTMKNGVWLDCFHLMDKPVCYIFGDVVFSAYAIETIVNTDTDSIEFYASAEPLPEGYPKEWAEPFAYKVRDHELFRHCVEVAKHYERLGLFRRSYGAIAWELWQVIKGTPLNCIDYTNYVAINDWTCDLDKTSDVDLMERRVQ